MFTFAKILLTFDKGGIYRPYDPESAAVTQVPNRARWQTCSFTTGHLCSNFRGFGHAPAEIPESRPVPGTNPDNRTWDYGAPAFLKGSSPPASLPDRFSHLRPQKERNGGQPGAVLAFAGHQHNQIMPKADNLLGSSSRNPERGKPRTSNPEPLTLDPKPCTLNPFPGDDGRHPVEDRLAQHGAIS